MINPKDVDEVLDEANIASQPEAEGLPEAPASATVHAWDKDNFGVLFTLRDTDARSCFTRMTNFLKVLKAEGWKPDWKNGEAPIEKIVHKKVNQETCPHENKGQKKASGFNKPENKDKIYDYCLDCNKFLNWK